MEPYLAVFSDIDGTLLDSQHRLGQETVEAVRRIVAAGVPFVLVSARAPAAVFPIQDELAVATPIVAYGGALVLDQDRRPVHSLLVPQTKAREIHSRLARERPLVTVTFYSHDDWLVDDTSHPRVVLEAKITSLTPIPFDSPGAEDRVVHKILCLGDPGDIAALAEELPERYPDLSIFRSSQVFLEIMHGDATKANAVHYLCQALRLPLERVVAFGDNYNDVDMLQQAGLGVAMANAPAEVRDGVGRVTEYDNDHDGVARFLATIPLISAATSLRFTRASFPPPEGKE
jgi:Cof subfamily protein (haloacid dehalogenase superfamily)